MNDDPRGPEGRRLDEDERAEKNWKRWGPYLSERQWGTVREDYSPDGDSWGHLTHDQSRSRAYRWGEDGLLGITDRECRLCFSVALWNGQDPILKERLYGLTGPEGNHGEDVKELYYYLDSTPTHSWMRALYKYPQAAFPYARLVEENRRRGKHDPEFELADTGLFDEGRYFDVEATYAKAGPNDLCIVLTLTNRGPEAATLHVLPTLWFRNTWRWNREGESYWPKPSIARESPSKLVATHDSLGAFHLHLGPDAAGQPPGQLFTDNETNATRLFGTPNPSPHVKDAFHEAVVHGRVEATHPLHVGTKAAAHYVLQLGPGETREVRLRLTAEGEESGDPFGTFDATLAARRAEADTFYGSLTPAAMNDDERLVARQAYAGLLWSKQYYHYVVDEWLEGDPPLMAPGQRQKEGRNREWRHLHARDVLSMPDKWEYPWFAAWDLAFHMAAFAPLDPAFAKQQLLLMLREWYMHPSGQLPAYEFQFGDVNPPVHAWACWRVYKLTGPRGKRDRLFLERAFQKLVINFTWWVNRKDHDGDNLFSGGFLGLDNIGVFDRSKPLPTGGSLEQADGTAWMAFYCSTLLNMALELASEDPAYEDVASKFFEHFVAIATAMNTQDGSGLWDEEDGFFYDRLSVDGREFPLKVRSMVGIIPMFAVELLDDRVLERLPGFTKRMNWFLRHRRDLAGSIAFAQTAFDGRHVHRLLAIPSRERLVRMLRYVLDEKEFLSPHGVRSLSRVHADRPFELAANGETFRVAYDPAESTSRLFGGNSNWRGPVWFPLNHLLVESLERYHRFYGDGLKVECPTGSGRFLNLYEVSQELTRRMVSIFLPDKDGRRPVHGSDTRYAKDPAFRDLVLFYEYFHGDNGRGIGASHQTGWTALVARWIEDLAKSRGK